MLKGEARRGQSGEEEVMNGTLAAERQSSREVALCVVAWVEAARRPRWRKVVGFIVGLTRQN